MRILFIEPRGTLTAGGMVGLTNVDVNEPIGICYLAAVAKRAGFQTRVVQQFEDVTNNEVLDLTKLYGPQVVGISTMTFNYKNGLRLAQEIKRSLPGTIIIFGGIHATLNPEIVLEPAIDFAVLGEGELIFIDLLKHIEDGAKDFQEIPGLAYDDNGNVVITKTRSRMTSDELTSLPFPDREDLSILRYKRSSLSYPPPSRQRHASINYGRGCNYSCTFCTSPKEWQNGWIARDPKNVVDEIDHLIKRYGTNFLFFRDEDLLLNKDKVTDLCEEILKRGIHISWYCHGRVSDINGSKIVDRKKLLRLMKKAGCFEIVYGIETGEADTLVKINKGATLTQAELAVRVTHESGIMTGCLFMIGFPWETEDSLRHTFDFAKKLKYDRIRITFATAFKGTKFYDESKMNLLTDDLNTFTTELPIIKCEISSDYLIRFRQMMYRELYYTGKYILRALPIIIKKPALLRSYLEWFKFLNRNLGKNRTFHFGVTNRTQRRE